MIDTVLAAQGSGFDSSRVMNHYRRIANLGSADPMLELSLGSTGSRRPGDAG